MPRYTVDLSDKVIDNLDSYADRQHISRAEALKRALSLLILADQESAKGNSLGIVREENNETRVVARLAGL
ncbi:hypothetical protein AAW18_07305 [Xanthomonas campestris pv. campestris]|nr:hypothetical protein AAW18_07305 [Xanthomonas campestris pv. campestris]